MSARRLRVVGTSGSGKTTLARAAARRLGVLHVELDEVVWQPGWVKRDAVEALADLRTRLDGSPQGWVVDGNWETLLGPGMPAPDALVWLDYPRRTVMARVLRRTLARGLLRTELWNGNREDLRNLLRPEPEENVVLWSWTSHARVAHRYAARAAAGDPVVRLRSPREARAWLRTLAPVPAGTADR